MLRTVQAADLNVRVLGDWMLDDRGVGLQAYHPSAHPYIIRVAEHLYRDIRIHGTVLRPTVRSSLDHAELVYALVMDGMPDTRTPRFDVTRVEDASLSVIWWLHCARDNEKQFTFAEMMYLDALQDVTHATYAYALQTLLPDVMLARPDERWWPERPSIAGLVAGYVADSHKGVSLSVYEYALETLLPDVMLIKVDERWWPKRPHIFQIVADYADDTRLTASNKACERGMTCTRARAAQVIKTLSQSSYSIQLHYAPHRPVLGTLKVADDPAYRPAAAEFYRSKRISTFGDVSEPMRNMLDMIRSKLWITEDSNGHWSPDVTLWSSVYVPFQVVVLCDQLRNFMSGLATYQKEMHRVVLRATAHMKKSARAVATALATDHKARRDALRILKHIELLRSAHARLCCVAHAVCVSANICLASCDIRDKSMPLFGIDMSATARDDTEPWGMRPNISYLRWINACYTATH